MKLIIDEVIQLVQPDFFLSSSISYLASFSALLKATTIYSALSSDSTRVIFASMASKLGSLTVTGSSS